MLDKIQRFAEKNNMFHSGDSVVCGLSGGADSVCLLTCLCELSEALGISVEALHVNHCLRGAESDRDEDFCRSLCQRMNVPFTAVSCDVRSFALAHSLSEEEAARKLRYEAFAENSKGKLIATAHNANDNLETAILNLARGSAIKGLMGIPPVRGNIVRPLLGVTRAEIEEYLNKKGISFVTDSTNLSDNYTRNKIRHQILPIINEINPSAVSTFVNSSDAMRNENSFIESETSKALAQCRKGNSLCGINSYHAVIRRRCIAKLLSDNNLPYSFERLEKCDEIAVNGGKINISKNIFLISDGTNIRLEKIEPKKSADIQLSAEMKLGKNAIFEHKFLFIELLKGKHLQMCDIVNTSLTIYYLDYDKIKGKVFIRNRRFGDRITLQGRSFTSSVKKLINEKIPPDFRSELHFLEDSGGTIFAEGIGIADRIAPDENTMNYLKITVRSC
ncbi:MAG: tRNA lysidine(34) synthetase TilS [Ruminococcus sp.]|nr:tRNA lysidine(34) synthetase TilS [Ruminococcus sp.]